MSPYSFVSPTTGIPNPGIFFNNSSSKLLKISIAGPVILYFLPFKCLIYTTGSYASANDISLSIIKSLPILVNSG